MERLLIENLATIVAITALLGAVALGPIGRAIARRIEGRLHGGPDQEVDRYLLELEQTRQRLLELEERMEFTERLLARGDAREIGRPGP
ncbi:MAG TPA: hypothetical protein VLD58_07630 [Gemmatimonadales bacterium]|nr:hypothetical protein [Gemmatimonadales bacterium]